MAAEFKQWLRSRKQWLRSRNNGCEFEQWLQPVRNTQRTTTYHIKGMLSLCSLQICFQIATALHGF